MAARTHAVPLDDTALAWLALALVPELPPRRAFALVERFGTPRAVLEAPAGALAAADAPPPVVTAIGQAPGRARAEARKLAAAGATLVAWSDGAYPPALRQIADPPLAHHRRLRPRAGPAGVRRAGAGRRGRAPRPESADPAGGQARRGRRGRRGGALARAAAAARRAARRRRGGRAQHAGAAGPGRDRPRGTARRRRDP